MPKSLRDCVYQTLLMPNAAALIIIACLAALAGVFIAQYGFDLQPCILCLWQRAPFGLALALAVAAYIWRPWYPLARILLGLCALLFLVGTALALFHTGVELHWWLGTAGCSVPSLNGSPEDLRTQLLHTVVARCDVIAWTFLGLSMANWNVLYSLGLALFSACAALVDTKAAKR